MNLATIDLVIVGAYFVLLLAFAAFYTYKPLNEENYMLAARKLSLPAFMMTLVTTWYGLILGVGEFVFGYGVVAFVTNGLVWYLVYFLFAFFFAKKIQKSQLVTVADHFTKRVGPKSAGFASFMTYIMTTPAAYVLSLAVLLQYLLGFNLWLSVAIGLVVSAAYIWNGGFKAVVKTDILQFFLMFFGFGSLLYFSIYNFGGLEFLTSNLPESHFTFKGELSWQTIIVWGFLAFWTLIDPNFYQRCYAAKDAKTAKRGVLISIGFWFVFDMLTLFTGLYAAAAFSDANPLFSYLVLADGVLPVVFKGMFLVGILAIIMSTIDSFLFSSSTIVAKDFLTSQRFKQWSLKKRTRLGIILTLVLSCVFIAVFESIIGIIYAIGTVGVGALLLPMCIVLFTKKIKLSDSGLFLSMIISALASTSWLVEGWLVQEYGWPVYRLNIEPMYIGILASALVLLVIFVRQIVTRKA
jgi:SSS family solute:Na+ symporter